MTDDHIKARAQQLYEECRARPVPAPDPGEEATRRQRLDRLVKEARREHDRRERLRRRDPLYRLDILEQRLAGVEAALDQLTRPKEEQP